RGRPGTAASAADRPPQLPDAAAAAHVGSRRAAGAGRGLRRIRSRGTGTPERRAPRRAPDARGRPPPDRGTTRLDPPLGAERREPRVARRLRRDRAEGGGPAGKLPPL